MPPTATSGGPVGRPMGLMPSWKSGRVRLGAGGLQPAGRGQFGRPLTSWPWAADRAAAFRRTRLGAGLDLLLWLGLDHPISLAAPTAVT